jgi:Protein of unknown function (DUF3572)
MPNQPQIITADEAEMMAIAALGFLADQPESLGRFLSITGIGPATLRRAAADRGFLAGVLDFLLGDEPLLLHYADTAGIDPAVIVAARRALESEPT